VTKVATKKRVNTSEFTQSSYNFAGPLGGMSLSTGRSAPTIKVTGMGHSPSTLHPRGRNAQRRVVVVMMMKKVMHQQIYDRTVCVRVIMNINTVYCVLYCKKNLV
jgi:hypothetical protein